jgi:hypothetical protein
MRHADSQGVWGRGCGRGLRSGVAAQDRGRRLCSGAAPDRGRFVPANFPGVFE